jgi:hypothetical protein
LFDRYDQALEARLTKMSVASRPVLRRPVIAAALCLVAVLVFLCLVERDLSGLFCAALAGVLVWNCLKRFKLEHSIVQSHGESLGKVSTYRRIGTKRGSIIDYTFPSADNKIYVGAHQGYDVLPQEGQTFLVVYNLADPSLNLPLFSFWFYRFAFESSENAIPSSA